MGVKFVHNEYYSTPEEKLEVPKFIRNEALTGPETRHRMGRTSRTLHVTQNVKHFVVTLASTGT